MLPDNDLTALLKRALVPAGCVVAIAYFGYHTLQGQNGLRAYGAYEAQIADLSNDAAKLRQQRQTLEHRLALLSPDRVDPDYADELVRRHLGLADPNEDIILLDPPSEQR